MKKEIIANFAEHGIKGVKVMVALRSFMFLMVRVDIIAGTEHPHPKIMETKLLPPKPILLSSLSVMKAIRDM